MRQPIRGEACSAAASGTCAARRALLKANLVGPKHQLWSRGTRWGLLCHRALPLAVCPLLFNQTAMQDMFLFSRTGNMIPIHLASDPFSRASRADATLYSCAPPDPRPHPCHLLPISSHAAGVNTTMPHKFRMPWQCQSFHVMSHAICQSKQPCQAPHGAAQVWRAVSSWHSRLPARPLSASSFSAAPAALAPGRR